MLLVYTWYFGASATEHNGTLLHTVPGIEQPRITQAASELASILLTEALYKGL